MAPSPIPARVESLQITPVALPFRHRYVTASGSLDRREMVIVRLRSTDGTTGYGDAVPLSLRGGSTLAVVSADLEQSCGRALEAFEFGPATLATVRSGVSACREAGAGPEALSAAGIALLDLTAKLHGVPAWSVLGAASPSPVACNGTIGMDAPGQAAEAAAQLVSAGFRTLKVKVGDSADLERVAAVREAAGPEVALRVDANGAWGSAPAIRSLQRMAAHRLELAEQPCAAIGDLATVRAATGVPIVADESVTDSTQAQEAIAMGAIDAATLKLAKVGGVTAAIDLSWIVPSYLSSALDSAIGIAAAAHAVQALERRGIATGLDHGLATSGLFTDNVANDESLRGPTITLTDRPGLGIDVDEAAIERLRLA